MALPPEPLAEVLPLAARVVLAEVIEASVVPPAPASRAFPIGAAPPLPEQTVRLRVERTLSGAHAPELAALKPRGAYLLAAGHRGPFLLDGGEPAPRILGRYGPDTWSLELLERALVAREK